MDGQNRPPLNADDVDGALRDALHVDPSSEFRSRARARVAHESMRPRWAVAAPLVLGASLAIVAIVVQFPGGAAEDRPQTTVGRTTVARTLSGPRGEPDKVRPATPEATVARTLSGPRGEPGKTRPIAGPRPPSGVDQPEVLLSPSEQAGVRLLFETVASGRLELPPEMLQDLSLPFADDTAKTEGDNQ